MSLQEACTLRIGFAAIPLNKKLLPVTSKKSARETVLRLMNVADYVAGLGIDFYRIPANISPYESLEQIEEAKEEIRELGAMFRQAGHPDLLPRDLLLYP